MLPILGESSAAAARITRVFVAVNCSARPPAGWWRLFISYPRRPINGIIT